MSIKGIKQSAKSYWRKLHPRYAGMVGGVIFFCLSLVPSLLPRASFLQGILSGITFAIGYGLGSLIGNIYQSFRRAKPKQSDATNFINTVVKVLLFAASILFLIKGYYWQNEIRVLTDSVKEDAFEPLIILIVGYFVVFLIIGLSRKILRLARRIGAWLGKRIPKKAATYLGGILTALLIILIVDGVIFRVAMSISNTLFGYQNTGTPDGIVQLMIPEVSGSPNSIIAWDTLGEKGREFVGKTSMPENINELSGGGAKQPIRIYSGIKSAPTQDAQLQQIISELNRTHAETRKAILVANSTGSGGIDPIPVGSLEHIYNGDTATVGMQYSYLPSWISFLADKEKAMQAGKAIFDATYEWWSKLDPANRPKLLVFGESLGSFGAEGAFSGEDDLYNRTDGALLIGPTNSNQIWSQFVAKRDAGSPQWQPTYKQGQFIRFADYPEDLQKPAGEWGSKRVVYFQHASDPVVWWSPELIFHKPDWLREPRGNDVSADTRWYPFVTFWQVVIDLPLAYGVPEGHGHKYGDKVVEGWINILEPSGWTEQKTQQLREIF